MKGTKDKILDAAEKLFATNGFAGTSLRSVIKAAGVNTASVHYHFGSKDGLVEAVLFRRVAPLNQERLRLLNGLETEYPTGLLPLSEVVRAFLEPVIRAHARLSNEESVDQARMFPRLMGRAVIETGPDVGAFFHRLFGEVLRRFLLALSRAMPDKPPEEVMWRMQSMVGAMVSTIALPTFHGDADQVVPGSSDPDVTLRRLIAFVTAGMQAEVPDTEKKDKH